MRSDGIVLIWKMERETRERGESCAAPGSVSLVYGVNNMARSRYDQELIEDHSLNMDGMQMAVLLLAADIK